VTYTQPPTSTPPSTDPVPPVVLPIVIGDQTPTTTAAPATDTPDTTAAVLPSSLPVTGSSSTVLALVGLVAVLLGAGLVFMGRRQPADA
jgi:LPXTG-motif cell wall-anchored protein